MIYAPVESMVAAHGPGMPGMIFGGCDAPARILGEINRSKKLLKK